MSHGPAAPVDESPMGVLKRSLSLKGRIVTPNDGEAWKLSTERWNKDNQEMPDFVISCGNTGDVIAALKYVKATKTDFTVACGRHSRNSFRNNTVCINLEGMRSVTIDPHTRIATVQGGCRNGDLDEEASVYGLGTPVGTNQDTGVGGLILGGGWGYLSRRYGMSIDNLVSMQVVTANLEVLFVSPTENEDLWWALRGAGSNFGIVTEFKVQLYPVGNQNKTTPPELKGKVLGGPLIFPFPMAPTVMQYFADETTRPDASVDLGMHIVLGHGPSGHKCVVSVPTYTGDDIIEGEQIMKPFHEFAEGKAVVNGVHPQSYLELQRALADLQATGYFCERGQFLNFVDEEVIRVMMAQYEKCPAGAERSVFSLAGFGGEIAAKPTDSSSFVGRKHNWWILLLGCWMDPSVGPAVKQWIQETKSLVAAVKGAQGCGSYSNSIEREDADEVFMTNIQRLRQLKAKWDPENLFHHNHNIKPAEAN